MATGGRYRSLGRDSGIAKISSRYHLHYFQDSSLDETTTTCLVASTQSSAMSNTTSSPSGFQRYPETSVPYPS
ncbi:hypothetical protein HBI56_131060 [Parastagonospora nodorum]|uniref:Uncharacterized protein n=1 Tax=Phaeosphaeria nodorum (strain SN15 / ATCC MYA-4574 / FGSC 10173) TaxID=321614 RepID=A0A7U2I178_PHANO|nr:hypothetical protein HBH56_152750 [Parastagonospora nodorum]QRC96061.1 hypothetical protein JI435_408250 [Parastagonospora nodorum SN15]KAH3926591.1 hypothetical protein HBH54_164930 [Parastagonospora nodorum]KAH3940432.1 hypothetical protein HBH53_217870 [Parastagonospora nodorum]KAH4029549.1 hypothetical protein HBI09_134790 [Parastagonospora nodorum]